MPKYRRLPGFRHQQDDIFGNCAETQGDVLFHETWLFHVVSHCFLQTYLSRAFHSPAVISLSAEETSPTLV
jgi:hypothetical protein